MAFKVQHAPTFKVKFPISIAGDGGEPWLIEAEFHYWNKSKVRAFFAELVASGKEDTEALPRILVGWSEADVGQPYSAAALTELLDEFPAAAADFFGAFRRELLESKRKN